MNNYRQHSRKILCIAIVLLCTIILHYTDTTTLSYDATAQLAEIAHSKHHTHDTLCASLSEKENDMFHATHEMGQWGIPSQSVNAQGATGRISILSKFQQRINRTYNILYASAPTLANGRTKASRHIVSAKRFHIGYYIYYRCQMRC